MITLCTLNMNTLMCTMIKMLFNYRLGKTIQVIGFLSGLFDMGKIKSVLIVLPVAVMVNWENEFNKW